MKSMGISALVALFAMLLNGCAINDSRAPTPVETNSVIRYKLPATYSEHQAFQQRFVSVQGDIAYTDHGEGETLVLLHGVPTSSWMYRKLIPKLQTTHRVISIDLLGYGSSAKPQKDPTAYRPGNQADLVRVLLEHLQVETYSILLHDMGGLVAWELLRDAAPISNLIILNTIVRDEGFEQPEMEEGLFTEVFTEAMSNTLTSKLMLENTFASMGLDMNAQLTDAEAMGYITPVRDGSDEAIYSFYTDMDEAFFEQLEANAELFQQFNGNTLILWGQKDNVLTTQQIPFLQKHLRIPDEHIKIFSKNGHFLPEEIPGALNREVLDFMANQIQ